MRPPSFSRLDLTISIPTPRPEISDTCLAVEKPEAKISDRDALADALVRLLDDESLRMQLGTSGRHESMQYSWPRVTSQVLDVYHAVMGRAFRP